MDSQALARNIAALTVDEAKEYAALFSVFKSKFPDMSDENIAWCVSVVTGVCPGCYEVPRGCHCQRDE